MEYGNPDFVKYAEAYGAFGHRVESAEGLAPLLEHGIKTPGVHVIDCPVDYSENDRILNQAFLRAFGSRPQAMQKVLFKAATGHGPDA
ncbi:Acetolactate synthase [Pseudomonas sp. 58 R 3]|nr:Acetolactate synthase [Pseudomonas sp. 58 R 3]